MASSIFWSRSSGNQCPMLGVTINSQGNSVLSKHLRHLFLAVQAIVHLRCQQRALYSALLGVLDILQGETIRFRRTQNDKSLHRTEHPEERSPEKPHRPRKTRQ